MFKLQKIAGFAANGGPLIARPQDGATPTRSGRFVVGAIEKHKSASRWPLSTIAWGTPLQLNNGKIQIKQYGTWNNLSALPGYFSNYKNNEAALVDFVKKQYSEYKAGLKNQLTAKEWSKEIPDTWMFNDFGHISIKYFKDINGNYKKDKNENFLSDFIHTIPNDEYRSTNKLSPLILPESHGCIHLHPKDIDTVIHLYIKIGTVIEIHTYSDTYVPVSMEKKYGHPPYELHFFPKVPLGDQQNGGQLVVYSVNNHT